MTVGQKVILLMKNLDLTQKDFGAELGIGQNQMSLIKNDKGEFAHSSLSVLITKFGINLNWLFADIGNIYIENKESNVVNESCFQKKEDRNKSI